MKASGYWFYFSGTEGYHCITGSNSRSAFPIGSMSLTHMPKLKSFSKKCCVVLTSTKTSGCQQPWPFVTLKENKCNCSQTTGQVCVASLWLRRSISASPAIVRHSAWALSVVGSLSPSRKTCPQFGLFFFAPTPLPGRPKDRRQAPRQHNGNATIRLSLLGGEAEGSQSCACCSQTRLLGSRWSYLKRGRVTA